MSFKTSATPYYSYWQRHGLWSYAEGVYEYMYAKIIDYDTQKLEPIMIIIRLKSSSMVEK